MHSCHCCRSLPAPAHDMFPSLRQIHLAVEAPCMISALQDGRIMQGITT